MAYQDKSLRNTNQIRVRFNDYDFNEIVSGANESQEQLAVFVRKIIVNTINNPELLSQILKNER